MRPHLLSLTLSALAAPCLAQPQGNAPPAMGSNAPVEVPAIRTPVEGARRFMQEAIKSSELGLTFTVLGARIGYFGSEDWLWAHRYLAPLNSAVIDDLRVEEENKKEATVTISYHFKLPEMGPDGTPTHAPVKKNVEQLKLLFDANGDNHMGVQVEGTWRVVPSSLDELLQTPIKEIPPFQLTAVLVVRDPRMLPIIKQQQELMGPQKVRTQQQLALSQLKQLALGAMMFLQDYDDIYAFDDEAKERALMPYLKDKTLFTIMGTNEKWHFNPNLSGVSMARLNNISQTVLFYDGDSPDNLKARFDNKFLIGFADGHCSLLSEDQIKNLVWKP